MSQLMFRLLTLLLLSPLWLAAAPQALVKDFTPSEKTAEAIALYQEGDGTPEDLAAAFPIFEAESAAGDPVAQFYAGQMLRQAQGTPLDYDRAIEYFTQAGEQGVAEAWTRIGVIYDQAKGRDRDFDQAISYFRKSMRVDPSAMNSIGYHMIEGRLVSNDASKSFGVILTEKAIEGGDINAMNNLGYYHAHNRIDNADPERGVALLQQSAELGYPLAWVNLARIYRDGKAGQPKDREKSTAAFKNAEKLKDAKIDKMIKEAVYVYRKEGIDAGIQRLSEKADVYINGKTDFWEFRGVAWWEAQVLSGREDPEWSLRIYQWIYETQPRYSETFSETLLGNIVGAQVASGRLGEIGRTREDLVVGTLKDTGVDLNIHPREALNWGKPMLPDETMLDMPVHNQPTGDEDKDRRFLGKVLSQDSGDAFSTMQTAAIMVGNWRDALAYTYWGEKWADEKIASSNDKAMNVKHYEEAKYDVVDSRAALFRRLGFVDEATAAYQELIKAKPPSYGGRLYTGAIFGTTQMQADYDLDFTYDLETLREMREGNANNKFSTPDTTLSYDITIAQWLRRNGQKEEANALVENVLENMIPGTTLEISARRARIGWDLEDGNLDRAEADLLRNLEISRQKGLKANEPGMYHQYAELEQKRGNLPEAIHLMESSIDLYKAVDLYTWLPERYTGLAEMYRLTGALDRAAYYPTLAERLLNTPGAQYPQWLREKVLGEIEQLSARIVDDRKILDAASTTKTGTAHRDSSSGAVGAALGMGTNLVAVDLQPLNQVAAPLAGQTAMGIFTLSNLSTREQTVTLIARGAVTGLSDSPEDGAVLVDLDGTETREWRIQLTLGAEEQRFISVETQGAATPVFLELELQQDGAPPQLASFLAPETAGGSVAVVNAALIAHNPFYAVSIFHVLQRIDGTAERLNLRFAASQPARIEGYDQAGSLLFVDADGDGKFQSPGDLLRVDGDNDGAADISFATGETVQLIEISILPMQATDAGELSVVVSHREGAAWIDDAEDRVIFSSVE